MSEGLEAGLQPQDLADLLQYICTADAKRLYSRKKRRNFPGPSVKE
jgi:hypothetical protein